MRREKNVRWMCELRPREVLCRILRWNARCSVQHQGWFPRISRWNSHQSLFVERISDSYWEWDPDPSSMVAAAWMRRAVVGCRPCKGALDSKGTDVTNMKQDMLGRLRYQNVGEDCFLIFLRFAMAHFQFKKYWRTVSIVSMQSSLRLLRITRLWLLPS